jgi:hypothetical protein
VVEEDTGIRVDAADVCAGVPGDDERSAATECASRVCTECGLSKPDEEYHWKSKGKRRMSWCKACAALRARVRIRGRIYKLLQHYSKSDIPFCACCGEKNPEFLAIDHPNNDGAAHRKQFGAERKGWRFRQWLMSRKEMPEGYRVLCHNCNQSLGSYGYCPHQNDLKTFDRAYAAWVALPERPRNLKINADIARAIKSMLADGVLPMRVAKELGVKYGTVYAIRSGRQWKSA